MDDRQTRFRHRTRGMVAATALAVVCLMTAGCKSPQAHRIEADDVAGDIIKDNQGPAIGRSEAFTIETPADALRRRLLLDQGLQVSGPASLGTDQLEPVPHWPGNRKASERGTVDTSTGPIAVVGPEVQISLVQALQIAARNNREYQDAKESVFVTALSLDLESQDFRNTYAGLLDGTLSHDESGATPVGGATTGAEASWSRRFRSGAALTGRIGVDLVKLLTRGYDSSLGVFADASISVPLLRGAGRHIVTESLTQAQRNVIYSLYALERHKRTLAVQVASSYLGVLQQADQINNASDNYDRLLKAAVRADRLYKAERLKKTEVDEAQQDVLRARERVISARNVYEGRLDSLKITLGLPTDARIALDPRELSSLVDRAKAAVVVEEAPDADEAPDKRGKFELPVGKAVELALTNRLDLRTAQQRVIDAQRGVVVATDGLKADLTLTGSGAMGAGRGLGSAAADNAHLRPEKGTYSATVASDLPWERTAERNAYRTSYITLERATRSVQDLEDRIKLSIRGALRTLTQTRKTFAIQSSAVGLALSRVKSTEMFLQAGRLEIQEVLKAQESLVQAQDSLTAALVDYRIAELELQRDMGVLEVDAKGLWNEYQPENNE